MPRVPRLFLPNQPVHLVVRGHSRKAIVTRKKDCEFFLQCLRETSQRQEVALHAWVLMTNHLHLLLTPGHESSLSGMMQLLGSRYARYFNRSYGRTGALWEGRYKTSFIDTEGYLLTCYRYIEMNPVRAGMVSRPEEYSWSSHRYNGFGIPDELTSPHAIYLALGRDGEERTARYRAMFGKEMDRKTLTLFRRGANKGKPVGNLDFLLKVTSLQRYKVL